MTKITLAEYYRRWSGHLTLCGGIPSTILFGWFSDLLGGRRGMVSVLCMVPIFAAFVVIGLTPAGYFGLDLAMLAIVGFFIYPVINLVVIQALDLTSKKAIGTAAGFIGLFGYLGRAAQGKGFGWMLKHLEPSYGSSVAWSIVIAIILILIAIALPNFLEAQVRARIAHAQGETEARRAPGGGQHGVLEGGLRELSHVGARLELLRGLIEPQVAIQADAEDGVAVCEGTV
jgi:MFS family permease